MPVLENKEVHSVIREYFISARNPEEVTTRLLQEGRLKLSEQELRRRVRLEWWKWRTEFVN
jgi:hypothetical protein